MQGKLPDDHSLLKPEVDADAAAAPPPRPAAAGTPHTAYSLGVMVLAVLAVLYTLYFARSFLVPIVFAVMLDFLLSPAVRAFQRIRIPPPVSAGFLVLILVGLTALGIYQLSGPVQDWATKAPQSVAVAERQLRRILRPIERVTRSAEQVESAAGGVSTADKPPEVVVKSASVTSRLFGSTQRFLASALEVIILLYFLLAAGDLFLTKLIRVLPNLPDKLKAIKIARETESSISTYLLASLATNLGEGVLVAGALWLLDMPNPILWGVLAALLEFIPYLGALAMVVVLGVAGLATFPDTGHALAVPGVFLAINIVQANLVSPVLLGHRLALNPVALFIGLAFWFWLWGIPGAFLAVPMLAVLKICCDHIDSLKSVGEFLGEKGGGPRPALPA